METIWAKSIRNNMKPIRTEKLLRIWIENDRDLYSEEAFKIIEDLLAKRKVKLPSFEELKYCPICLKRTQLIQKICKCGYNYIEKFNKEIKNIKAKETKCFTCNKSDVYRAVIEDGGQGDWCPHCKKSLQKLEQEKNAKIIPDQIIQYVGRRHDNLPDGFIPVQNEPSDEMKKAISNIKAAWIVGFIISGLGIIMFIIGLISRTDTTYIWPSLIFSGWVFGFSYGIYKKSRICSTIIFTMWVLAFFNFAIRGEVVEAFFVAIVCYPYYLGLRGTFAYHNLVERVKI